MDIIKLLETIGIWSFKAVVVVLGSLFSLISELFRLMIKGLKKGVVFGFSLLFIAMIILFIIKYVLGG